MPFLTLDAANADLDRFAEHHLPPGDGSNIACAADVAIHGAAPANAWSVP